MSAQGENILAWLDNALREREESARAASAFGDAFAAGDEAPDCVYGTGPGGPYMRVAVPGFEGQTEAAVSHFALHGPESVLLRCAADRKLIDSYRDLLVGAPQGHYADAGDRAMRLQRTLPAVQALRPVIQLLAEGYGWTEGER